MRGAPRRRCLSPLRQSKSQRRGSKHFQFLVDLSGQQGNTIMRVEHVMKLVISAADRITVFNFGQKLADVPDVKCLRLS